MGRFPNLGKESFLNFCENKARLTLTVFVKKNDIKAWNSFGVFENGWLFVLEFDY